jgi:hypothetical protein
MWGVAGVFARPCDFSRRRPRSEGGQRDGDPTRARQRTSPSLRTLGSLQAHYFSSKCDSRQNSDSPFDSRGHIGRGVPRPRRGEQDQDPTVRLALSRRTPGGTLCVQHARTDQGHRTSRRRVPRVYVLSMEPRSWEWRGFFHPVLGFRHSP